MSDREQMEFDVAIVGAGPAGLAAAIRLKQIAPRRSVAVLEKGSEVGAHILSGAVIDPIGLDALLPGWRSGDSPLKTPVTRDRFYWLGAAGAFRIPNIIMPPLMNNHGNYIASLGDVCRWLAKKAEALGVEVFPGFAATETLHDKHGAVVGVATGDMGVARDGTRKPTYQRGVELRAKYTLIAEGARGSLTKRLTARYGLDLGRDPQKYGIGIKELWQVEPLRHRCGLVQHTFGWPLDNRTGGGSFLYHLDDNLVSVGFVVHLNYKNPHLSPFAGIPEVQEPPGDRAVVLGRKATGLWRAGDHRGRVPVGAEADVSGRRAHRLRGRVRQRAAHQGQPQRNPLRHGGGGTCRSGDRRRPGARRSCRLRRRVADIGDRSRPQARAQRQAAVVALRYDPAA